MCYKLIMIFVMNLYPEISHFSCITSLSNTEIGGNFSNRAKTRNRDFDVHLTRDYASLSFIYVKSERYIDRYIIIIIKKDFI